MMTDSEQQEAREHLKTARDCLRWAESLMRRESVFLGHGTDDYWDEGLSLLLHVLHLPWESDPRILDARLLPGEVSQFVALLRRRIEDRLPAAYLTGQAWFCGLPFKVDKRVLIPRSPLAELIEVGFEPFVESGQVQRVLDLCTGSGCIAIASAYAFPGATVDASDISADALAVCEENIREHGLAHRVTAIESDGLTKLQGSYDLIVSNPPYVGAEEMASLPPEYAHEPGLALASGEDGLDFTRQLLLDAPDYLSEQGILIVEVGNTWEVLQAHWPEVPFFWFSFERGGQGVFMLTRDQLVTYGAEFRNG